MLEPLFGQDSIGRKGAIPEPRERGAHLLVGLLARVRRRDTIKAMRDEDRSTTKFEAFLRALIRVPKGEIDRLEAARPKKTKRKKPAA